MIRPRPTLPHALACSTIGAESLNFRVRNGNGCDPFAIKTGILKSNFGSLIFLIIEYRLEVAEKIKDQASRPISTS